MSLRLEGKRAVVTGGSRGIGAAIVSAFAAEGAAVAFCHDGDAAGAATISNVVTTAGGQVFERNCDLSDLEQASSFFDDATRALGGIDILVNNAGIGGEVPFERLSMALFDRMIAVNLRAVFHLSHLAAPGMRRRRWGRIINIASQLAYKGAPGMAHYCAAKAGVVGLTRALGAELAPDNVLVNAIAPGLTDTRLNEELSAEWKAWKVNGLPIGRMGRPEEIAPTAVLLASADGDYYVGQTLSPNGGDVYL